MDILQLFNIVAEVAEAGVPLWALALGVVVGVVWILLVLKALLGSIWLALFNS